MSVVSGVTIQANISNEDFIENINKWLKARYFSQLCSVEHYYGGDKHPQVKIWGGGFNYFPEDDFASYIISLPWKFRENVVLLINPEEGSTRVWQMDRVQSVG